MEPNYIIFISACYFSKIVKILQNDALVTFALFLTHPVLRVMDDRHTSILIYGRVDGNGLFIRIGLLIKGSQLGFNHSYSVLLP